MLQRGFVITPFVQMSRNLRFPDVRVPELLVSGGNIFALQMLTDIVYGEESVILVPAL